MYSYISTKIILKWEQNNICKKNYFWFLRFHLLTSYPLPKKTIPEKFLLTEILDKLMHSNGPKNVDFQKSVNLKIFWKSRKENLYAVSTICLESAHTLEISNL